MVKIVVLVSLRSPISRMLGLSAIDKDSLYGVQ